MKVNIRKKEYGPSIDTSSDRVIPGVLALFREVELPCIQVIAEMELNGVLFDTAYADRLRVKFEGKLNACDAKINEELDLIKEQIKAWRLTPEANTRPLKKGKTAEDANAYGKSKAEQLEDPIALSSPTQLAILLYDIMKVPVTDKDAPRGTGEAVLEALKGKYKICEYLLERRGLEKMLNAFINSLPNEVNPKTGKIHCSFNQYGAATGRTSCSGPNLQQIPSHEKSIRLLFMADCPEHQVEIKDNYYEVPTTDEVETINGWKKVKELAVGDIIIGENNQETITKIDIVGDNYLLYV